MRNAFKFAVLAVMLFLVQFSFADTTLQKDNGMRRIIIVPLTQTVLQLHQSKETSFP